MDIITNEEYEKTLKLTKNDVWGDHTKGTKGLIVARSGEICPIFKDKIPYKSVTVICDEIDEDVVSYWLDYVLGGGSISCTIEQPNNKIAIRADYRCW